MIRLLVNFLEALLNTFYRDRLYPRFYVLETVARVSYFAYTSALHLYETMGWWRKDDFYNDVLADDTVNHFFAHTDMEKQRSHQAAFISYALGGTAQYTGRSMEKAHAGLNLQPEHFDAIVKHLSDALAEHSVSPEEIDAVIERVATLKEAILYK